MIRLEGIGKQYPNGQVAVRELSLDIPTGEICVLVGPSGCGKTTTLKMINRLIEPTAGRIFLDGDDVTHADPVELRRHMGYVIQQIGLFPHQTIATNIATVPKLLGWSKARIATRTDELLDLVGLDPSVYGERYPAQLSGGQRQRVGVARALAADPPVLLMDEPFGAIDPVTRVRLQDEFLRLQGEVNKTVVFVTHDIEEAVKMGDRIAILDVGGILEQYATPAEILGRPASPMVRDFVGRDRALKRLRVTPIDPACLEHPPTVAPTATLAEARRAIEQTTERWVAVVDADGVLHGYVDESHADGGEGDGDGERSVADHVQRIDTWVPLDGDLQDALATMLLTRVGWVSVIDDDRFLGVLTPEAVYRTLRKSLGDAAPADGARDDGVLDHGALDDDAPAGN
jgi:osmoprotectant transport system ATP-binding protein